MGKEFQVATTEILAAYFHRFMTNPANSDEAKDRFRSKLSQELALVINNFKKLQVGVSRAKKVHDVIDSTLLEKSNQKFIAEASTCKKGCAHCCYLHVTVTEDEADLIERLVRRRKIQIDKNRLLKQLPIAREDFIKHPLEVRRCVFLGDDNLCTIYQDRPTACRTYFSAEEPERCYLPPEKEPEDIKKLFLLGVEIISSGAMNTGKEMPETIAYWFKKKGLI